MRLRATFKLLHRALRRMIAEDGLVIAGYMSFMTLLSLFPFVLFLTALTSFLGTEEDFRRVVELMFDIMPSEVAAALEPVVGELLVGRKGGFLTFGVLATLWASTNGIETLRLALNRAYGVVQTRPFWLCRLQSLLFVLLSVGLVLVMSLLIVFGPILWRAASSQLDLATHYQIVWIVVRYGLAVSTLFVVLIAVHRYLPNREQSYRRVLPGVLFTVVTLVLVATGFSIYLDTFADYSVTYGSLASVVIALMFFYVSSIVFVLGGYVNGTLGRRQRKQLARMESAILGGEGPGASA